MFDSFSVSASGIQASRVWLDVVANNLANTRTVVTPGGGPYQRQTVVFEQVLDDSGLPQGVGVAGVVSENRQPEMRHEPGHPLADEQGMVAYPSVDLAQEMLEMIAASRSLEANAMAMSNAKTMLRAILEI